MPQFGQRSKDNLSTAHPLLQRLFNFIILYYDCSVICGHRGQKAQDTAFNAGHSKLRYPHSQHNKVPSFAVDVVPYPLDWDDITEFERLGELVKVVATGLNIPIIWGGDWNSLRDYPHYQLDLHETDNY